MHHFVSKSAQWIGAVAKNIERFQTRIQKSICFLLRTCQAQRTDIGRFFGFDVLAGCLAKRCTVSGDIQYVIGDLKSQAYCCGKLNKGFALCC